jgi:hypothetical protein
MKGADNFLGWFAEALKEKLNDLVFVPPREIKVGDVVTTIRFTQFHNDITDVNEFDVVNGLMNLRWTFYNEGSLFLVLGRDGDRVSVMALESGVTGWMFDNDVKHLE